MMYPCNFGKIPPIDSRNMVDTNCHADARDPHWNQKVPSPLVWENNYTEPCDVICLQLTSSKPWLFTIRLDFRDVIRSLTLVLCLQKTSCKILTASSLYKIFRQGLIETNVNINNKLIFYDVNLNVNYTRLVDLSPFGVHLLCTWSNELYILINLRKM